MDIAELLRQLRKVVVCGQFGVPLEEVDRWTREIDAALKRIAAEKASGV